MPDDLPPPPGGVECTGCGGDTALRYNGEECNLGKGAAVIGVGTIRLLLAAMQEIEEPPE